MEECETLLHESVHQSLSTVTDKQFVIKLLIILFSKGFNKRKFYFMALRIPDNIPLLILL